MPFQSKNRSSYTTDIDPISKREQFAVSLRKKKKEVILTRKRERMQKSFFQEVTPINLQQAASLLAKIPSSDSEAVLQLANRINLTLNQLPDEEAMAEAQNLMFEVSRVFIKLADVHNLTPFSRSQSEALKALFYTCEFVPELT